MAIAGCNASGALTPARLLTAPPCIKSSTMAALCSPWGPKAILDRFAINATFRGNIPNYRLLPREYRLCRKGAHFPHHGISALAVGGDENDIVTVKELGDGSMLYSFNSPPSHENDATQHAASGTESVVASVRSGSAFQKRSPIPKLSQKQSQHVPISPLSIPPPPPPTLPKRPPSTFNKRSPIQATEAEQHTSVLSSTTAAGLFSDNGAAAVLNEASGHLSRPPSSFNRRSPIPPEATRGRRKITSPVIDTDSPSHERMPSDITAIARPPSNFVRRSPIPVRADGGPMSVRPVASLGGPAFEAARRNAAMIGSESLQDEATVKEEEKVVKKATRRGRKRAVVADAVVVDGESDGLATEKVGKGRGRRKAAEKGEEQQAVEPVPLASKHPLPSRLVSNFVRRSPIPERSPLRELVKEEDVMVVEEVKVRKRRGRKPASAKLTEGNAEATTSTSEGVKLVNSDAPNKEAEYLALFQATNAKLKEMAKARGIKRWSMMQRRELMWHLLEADHPGKFKL